jgi:hypothetical protein
MSSTPPPPGRFHQLGAPLTVSNFRRYVSGQALSLIGPWVETVAQGLLVVAAGYGAAMALLAIAPTPWTAVGATVPVGVATILSCSSPLATPPSNSRPIPTTGVE